MKDQYIGRVVAEVGNNPQIEGAEKYGYTFVSTKGVPCKLTHPTPDGYQMIADRILEALPDVNFAYDDAAFGSKYYEAASGSLTRGEAAKLISDYCEL